MMRGKRSLDPSDRDDVEPEGRKQKVPALASVIVEALKVDSLQKLCSSLEPILRRVVSEEVERALAKLGPAKLTARSSPKQIEGPDGRNLQLHFRSRLSLPLFTGGKVEGEQGAAIHVVLLDANTDCVVTTGLESYAKLDVVVLDGDFNNEDEDGWTEEEFESHVIKEREGKRPLLTGDLQVSLKEGVGTLGDLTFTDNSSWIRSRKFRLGLKVASGCCEGVRVCEAKTDAFTVKDHRGELYKKHYPPALSDDVWRLEKIGKDGAFHKKLNKAGIYTVEDFLRLVVRDSQRLRSVLGSGMSNKMWESLVEHAKTCVLGGKHYVYYPDDTRNIGVVFNNIYELRGLITDGQYYSAEALSDGQKVFVDTLVKKAYDNWMHVVEYDGSVLLNSKQSKRTSVARNESPTQSDYPTFDQQASLPHLPVPVPAEQASGNAGLAVGGNSLSSGIVEKAAVRYQTQHIMPNGQVQFEANSLVPQNQIASNDGVGLALGLPHSSNVGFQSLMATSSQSSSNLNTYEVWPRQQDNRGVEDYFTEEEIRMRSHEMLEHEDMQHLLRIFSMGGTSASMPEETYSYPTSAPSPMPNYTFDDDRSRPSGKAVVGWLKLKAALRWGIFIRRKAAERRAQLVELED